jgi:uncharacterized membrane protein
MEKINKTNFVYFYLIITFIIFIVIFVFFINEKAIFKKTDKNYELKKTACYSASSTNNCNNLIDSPATKEECCSLFDKCCE